MNMGMVVFQTTSWPKWRSIHEIVTSFLAMNGWGVGSDVVRGRSVLIHGVVFSLSGIVYISMAILPSLSVVAG